MSGIISITANACDNVAIVGVQFKIDGTVFGSEDTSAPYSVPWNTACNRIGADIDVADIRTERVEEFLAATGVNH